MHSYHSLWLSLSLFFTLLSQPIRSLRIRNERTKPPCLCRRRKLEFSPGGRWWIRPVRASATREKLNVFVCLMYKRSPVLTYHNFVLRKLCYYYALLGPHRKWLCYFFLYSHGKLDLRFVHGRAEKWIGNGAHIIGRNRRGK